MPREKIDILLNLVPDAPSSVALALTTQPYLASQSDSHGYSLLHAAASYKQNDLLHTLITRYGVDPNLTDEDGETALFVVEDVGCARLLLELGCDASKRNDEGLTAEEKIEGEAEYPLIAAFLRNYTPGAPQVRSAVNGAESTSSPSGTATEANANGATALLHPPPIPSENIKITTGYMPDPNAVEGEPEPDPEMRRRIEELASRDDFQTEEGQRQLRELVTDIVGGLRRDAEANAGGGDISRRRVED
jgi:uncharacterized protein